MIFVGVYHLLKRSDSQFFFNAAYFLKGILLTLDFLTRFLFSIGSFWLASTGYFLGPWSSVATLPVKLRCLGLLPGYG